MKLFLIVLACCSVALAPLPALADDTLKVIIVDGDEAANIVAERIAAEPVVEVRDREDRRVANAVVRFLIRRTARNRLAAVFRNGQSEVRTLTDASGRASVNLSPVEAGSFEIEVEASYQGQTGKAVIRHSTTRRPLTRRRRGASPARAPARTRRPRPEARRHRARAGWARRRHRPRPQLRPPVPSRPVPVSRSWR